MRRVYRVYSEDFSFLIMLAKLRSKPPVTLGASRSPDESTSQLYKRNLSPWIDKHYIYTNSLSRMFILHKLFTEEILFWKNIAKEHLLPTVRCTRGANRMYSV